MSAPRQQDEGERLPGVIAGFASSVGHLLAGLCSLPSQLLHRRELKLQVDVEAKRTDELERALEQTGQLAPRALD